MLIGTDNYGNWQWLQNYCLDRLTNPIILNMPLPARNSYRMVNKGLGQISFWLPTSNRNRVYVLGMGSLCL